MNKKIIFLFIIWRVLDFLVIYLTPRFIPYLGFFPYKELLADFNLPHWLNSLANFDGIHYLLIARQGYGQWEQAFFPAYPFIIRLLTFVINNRLAAGLILSNLSFLVGLIILRPLQGKQAQDDTNVMVRLAHHDKWFWFLIFLLVFPTSFFFGAIYTEGLFLLLFAAALYFLKDKKYLLASLLAILTSLTRLIGIFLIIPIVFQWLKKRRDWKILISAGASLVGFGVYCFYLWRTTGDPFFFLTSQPVFGANRSTSLILLPQVIWRYIKIFITADHNFQYFISLLEFSIFTLVFTVLIFDLFKQLRLHKNFKLEIINFERLGLNLFSLANLLLPTLTGTFSSVPRYALFSLSFFIYLTEIKSIWIKMIIALVFLILHITLLGFFSQGYFIS